tara:strand:+ start:569 stop:1147 length:579 start_codon:yes stop_codon:yes gene_type:complete
MYIINTIERTHSTAWLRPLLHFAAKGIDTDKILVEVKWEPRCSASGMAYPGERGALGIGERVIDYKFKVDLRYGERLRPKKSGNVYNLKRINDKYPRGVFLECPEDHIVWLAAHEFRHIWQFKKREVEISEGKKPKRRGELDAERHAIKKVNDFRAATNRRVILPISEDEWGHYESDFPGATAQKHCIVLNK